VNLSIYCVIFVTAYKATVTYFVTATAAATFRIIVTITTFRYAFNHSLRILLCTRTSLNVSPKMCDTKPRSTVIATSERTFITPRAFHASRIRTMCSRFSAWTTTHFRLIVCEYETYSEKTSLLYIFTWFYPTMLFREKEMCTWEH
jgi:hypothetical protein